MKTDLRRFVPLGLGLAVLAALGFIVILVVKGLGAGGIFTPPDPALLDRGLWICAGILILGLALAAFLDPERARKFFVGRQLQYGSNATVMLVAFIGILIFLNMLVYQYSSTATPWDWTEDKQNTLAPETLNTLSTLPEPVAVHAYYSTPEDGVQTLLESYKQNSGGKLTYEIINPYYEPTRAQADGVTRDGTIVAIMGERREVVTFASEQDMDVALVKLINPTQHMVYFLSGHGERGAQTDGDTAMTEIKTALRNKNYLVELLNLNNQTTVPANAKVVVVAGPQIPLTVEEVKLLEAYLDKGGSLIVMEDPTLFTKFGTSPDPLAEMLETKWGITLEDNVIIDTTMGNAFNAVADIQSYNQHHPVIYKILGYTLLFNTARSLTVSDVSPEDISVTPLAKTNANGGGAAVWGETDFGFSQEKQPSFDPASDVEAPLTLFVAGQNIKTNARVTVFGDSDFATDAYQQQQSFGEVLINAVDWSAQQENLISLTPKNNVKRSFRLPNTLETIGTILLSVCIIPLLVAVAAIVAWYSRRRRG